MRNVFTLAVLSILSWGTIIAQDAHLSQFSATPMALNPAMTGLFEGNQRGHLHYRSQWNSVIQNPYTTANAAFDQAKKRFGLGGYVLNSRAGRGFFNVLSILSSISYEVTNDAKGIHHLTTGVQLGIIQKSVDVNKLTFDNQYSKNNGGGFDPNITSGEYFENTSIWLPEVNFGIYYCRKDDNSLLNPYFGASGFHLTQPKETFLGPDNRLPLRIVGFGGTKIKVTDQFGVDFNTLYMRQINNEEWQIGAIGYYYLQEHSNSAYFLGTHFRRKDAFVVHTGFIHNDYTIRFSYDINTSALNAYSRGRGGFEISLTYIRQRGKFIPSIL